MHCKPVRQVLLFNANESPNCETESHLPARMVELLSITVHASLYLGDLHDVLNLPLTGDGVTFEGGDEQGLMRALIRTHQLQSDGLANVRKPDISNLCRLCVGPKVMNSNPVKRPRTRSAQAELLLAIEMLPHVVHDVARVLLGIVHILTNPLIDRAATALAKMVGTWRQVCGD